MAAVCGELRWDIFCRVVDNLGDIGVCWRLARGLAAHGQSVRLYVDDAGAGALAWMAPEACAGVQVLRVQQPDGDSDGGVARAAGSSAPGYEPADVLVAAFGCRLPPAVVDALVRAGAAPDAVLGRSLRHRPHPRVVWIHLEYLSAEPYAAASHGLASPVLGGAAAGVHRWFFFPGFTPATGGVLREPDLYERQRRFERKSWLASRGIAWAGEPVLSLFCYEPPLLEPWLEQLGRGPACCLLVTQGRAAAAVRLALARMPAGWNREARLRIHFLPVLTQIDFDHLLWSADGNFVRGEDSLIRALWAGTGLVWQAYPQDDRAHDAKLQAFLDWLEAPASLRRFTLRWNGTESGPLPAMPAEEWGAWRAAVQRARARLAAQTDLVSRLLRFVAENRKIAG